jgi:uncharacterized protein YmfQ (DUF2313 family)
MASPSVKNRYAKLLKSLLPEGWVWDAKNIKSSTLSKLLSSMAEEYSRIEERALALVKESNPATTFELLPDWERVFGLPDQCAPDESLTLQQRRQRILQLLTTRGGQNKSFYQNLAAQFGYDVGVIEVADQPPFRAGIGRAGDRLTNGTWRYAFIIEAPADSIVKFRAGKSAAGERLLLVQNSTLQCLIEKYKPAHAVAIFTFPSP